jgi:hypothetical protein
VTPRAFRILLAPFHLLLDGVFINRLVGGSSSSSSTPLSRTGTSPHIPECLAFPHSYMFRCQTNMPSAEKKHGQLRSSDTSEATPDRLRRGSLRRLGSMATFQSLNPFNRRRSNNTICSNTASEENVSSPRSLAAQTPQTDLYDDPTSPLANMSRVDSATADFPPPSQPPQSKCYSYVPLNDGQTATSSLPRSRTFSNLPLPTRLRQPSQTLAPSKSYIRFPSGLATSGSHGPSRYKICESIRTKQYKLRHTEHSQ